MIGLLSVKLCAFENHECAPICMAGFKGIRLVVGSESVSQDRKRTFDDPKHTSILVECRYPVFRTTARVTVAL